mmetsp:Transcript_29679/g.50520  ORF Transcript_29679/g.50520 Transcript_29679/m.50520 type:complete len:83 (-) Transcript_29679:71-319(-)
MLYKFDYGKHFRESETLTARWPWTCPGPCSFFDVEIYSNKSPTKDGFKPSLQIKKRPQIGIPAPKKIDTPNWPRHSLRSKIF